VGRPAAKVDIDEMSDGDIEEMLLRRMAGGDSAAAGAWATMQNTKALCDLADEVRGLGFGDAVGVGGQGAIEIASQHIGDRIEELFGLIGEVVIALRGDDDGSPPKGNGAAAVMRRPSVLD
jgi:hypothetical protein